MEVETIKKDVGMSWELVRLGDILIYEQPTNYLVSTENYDDAYNIPVLTAGKSFILGYTNENEGVYQNLPAIIFDDFTTDIKYVDFPFKAKSSAMKILTADSSKADIKFLFYWLQTVNFDAGQHKRYWISTYANFLIPLPPLTTQKRIAEILDAADALRRKDQELLKKYDELAQAIFIDMFGDPVKNEKGWEVIELEKVCSKITDGEHINPETLPEGKPLIMAKDIRFEGVDFSDYKCVSENDFIKFTKKCNPKKGDLILVSRGATIGRCCVVDTEREFCLMGSTILIKPNNNLNTSYLNQLFKIQNFKSRLVNVSSASAQQAIYISNVKELKIPIPSLEHQKRFHETIGEIKKQIANFSVEMIHSDLLFQSLIQKAFKGELV